MRSYTVQVSEGAGGGWCCVAGGAGTGKQGEGKILVAVGSISKQPVKSMVKSNG